VPGEESLGERVAELLEGLDAWQRACLVAQEPSPRTVAMADTQPEAHFKGPSNAVAAAVDGENRLRLLRR
jgi:hypothetical protein